MHIPSMTPNNTPSLPYGSLRRIRRITDSNPLRAVIAVTLFTALCLWMLHERMMVSSSGKHSTKVAPLLSTSTIERLPLPLPLSPSSIMWQQRSINNGAPPTIPAHAAVHHQSRSVNRSVRSLPSILVPELEGEPRSIMIIAECLPYSLSYRWGVTADIAAGHIVDYQLLSLIDSLVALGHHVTIAAEDDQCQPDQYPSDSSTSVASDSDAASTDSSNDDDDINDLHHDIDDAPVILPHTSLVAASSLLPSRVRPPITPASAELLDSPAALGSASIAALRARGVAILAPLRGSISSLIHFATGHRVDLVIAMSGWCWDRDGWGALWNTFLYSHHISQYIPAIRSYAPMASIVAMTSFCPMHTTTEELPQQWWNSVQDVYRDADHIWVPSHNDYDRLINSVEGINSKLQLIPLVSLQPSLLSSSTSSSSSSSSTNSTDGASFATDSDSVPNDSFINRHGLLLIYPTDSDMLELDRRDAIMMAGGHVRASVTSIQERLQMFIETVLPLLCDNNHGLQVTIITPANQQLQLWIEELAIPVIKRGLDRLDVVERSDESLRDAFMKHRVLIDLWGTCHTNNAGAYHIPVITVPDFPGPKLTWKAATRSLLSVDGTPINQTQPSSPASSAAATPAKPVKVPKLTDQWPQLSSQSHTLSVRIDHMYRSAQWWTELSTISSVNYVARTLSTSSESSDDDSSDDDHDGSDTTKAYRHRQSDMLTTLRHQLSLPYHEPPTRKCTPSSSEHFYSSDHLDRMFAKTVFKDQSHGTFVDVGAYDDTATLHLEESRCWRGICVQPMEDAYNKVVESRQCLAYHGALCSQHGIRKFVQVEPSNDLPPQIAREAQSLSGWWEEMSIETRALIRQLEVDGRVQLSVRKVRCYRLDHMMHQLAWPIIDLLAITSQQNYAGSDTIASLIRHHHHPTSSNTNTTQRHAPRATTKVKVVLTSESPIIDDIMTRSGVYRSVAHFGSHSLYVAAINTTRKSASSSSIT